MTSGAIRQLKYPIQELMRKQKDILSLLLITSIEERKLISENVQASKAKLNIYNHNTRIDYRQPREHGQIIIPSQKTKPRRYITQDI